MSFNFNAMQYERSFRAKSLSNWEYPRFSPPLPRALKKNSKSVSDKNGHLLPTSKREGHFLGQYRGTYHLPLRITRSFAQLYDNCLSGRYKYCDYPRNLCCCQREQMQQHQCDWRETLGKKDDPNWQRPLCQTKCEGFQQMLAINDLHLRCKRASCKPKTNEKLVPRYGDSSLRNRKRLKKRPVTAFEFNRTNRTSLQTDDQPAADKSKAVTKSKEGKEPTKDTKDAKEAKEAKDAGHKTNEPSTKITAKSPTKAPKSKSKPKTK